MNEPFSIADFEALAARAFARLPRRFRRELGAVSIRVEDFPDAETAAAMRLRTPGTTSWGSIAASLCR